MGEPNAQEIADALIAQFGVECNERPDSKALEQVMRPFWFLRKQLAKLFLQFCTIERLVHLSSMWGIGSKPTKWYPLPNLTIKKDALFF